MGITLDEVLDLMGELLVRTRGVGSPSSVKISMASPVRQQWAMPNVNPDTVSLSVPVQSEVASMAAFLLADDQEVDLGLDLRDRFGNPTKPVGVPAWLVADPSLLLLKPSADGLTALVQAVGKVGTTQVSVKVRRSNNADDVVTGVQDFEIGASETTFVGLVTGPARDIATEPTTTTGPTVSPTTVDATGGGTATPTGGGTAPAPTTTTGGETGGTTVNNTTNTQTTNTTGGETLVNNTVLQPGVEPAPAEGPQGPQGAPGPQGAQEPQYVYGPQGPQGAQSYTI